MATAVPIAAATPIAGAPRITIVLMALATSFAVRQCTYTSAPGSFRWSTITIPSSFQSIVGNICLILAKMAAASRRTAARRAEGGA
jgi:hypothetical protein